MTGPARGRRELWRSLAKGAAVGALAGLLLRDLDLPALVSYWGDRVPLVLLVAVAGALVWPTRLRPMLVGSTLAAALVWLLVAFTPVTAWLAGGLVRRDTPTPAAAVFVFSSRVQTDGEPTATALARLLRGVELIGEGYARRLILSEIAEPGGSYATYARLLLRRLGQETELLVVGPVRNTRDEAVAVAGLCRARGFERILAVTSPSHSRRALGSLQAEGVEALSIPAVEVRFDLETLDRPEERLTAFGALVHERLGIWVYERRGWIGTRGRRAPTGGDAAPTSR